MTMPFFAVAWNHCPNPEVLAAIRADRLYGIDRRVIDPKCNEHTALILDMVDRTGEDFVTITAWIHENAPSAILSFEAVEAEDSPTGEDEVINVIEIADTYAAVAFKLRFQVIELPW